MQRRKSLGYFYLLWVIPLMALLLLRRGNEGESARVPGRERERERERESKREPYQAKENRLLCRLLHYLAKKNGVIII